MMTPLVAPNARAIAETYAELCEADTERCLKPWAEDIKSKDFMSVLAALYITKIMHMLYTLRFDVVAVYHVVRKDFTTEEGQKSAAAVMAVHIKDHATRWERVAVSLDKLLTKEPLQLAYERLLKPSKARYDHLIAEGVTAHEALVEALKLTTLAVLKTPGVTGSAGKTFDFGVGLN